jgi:hypothetical protein
MLEMSLGLKKSWNIAAIVLDLELASSIYLYQRGISSNTVDLGGAPSEEARIQGPGGDTDQLVSDLPADS